MLLDVGRLPAREWLQGRKKGCVGLSVGCGTREVRGAVPPQAMPRSAPGGLCNRRACPGGRNQAVAEGKAAGGRVGCPGNADWLAGNGGPQSSTLPRPLFLPARP